MAQALIQSQPTSLNGFDVPEIEKLADLVTDDPAQALTEFRVTSTWAGGAAAEHRVEGYELGGKRIARRHLLRSDEPREFFGGDTAPNPQEYLFSALNGCILFGYATKAAVLGLTRSLAHDHAAQKIRVNAVCPGFTITGFHIKRAAERGVSAAELRAQSHPGLLKRPAEPREIAAAILFLASDEASYIPRATLLVDGGLSC